MKALAYIIAVLACLNVSDGLAQLTLDRQVIGTVGRSEQAGGISIDYTVGEPINSTRTNTISDTIQITLTQGFQQPDSNLSTNIDPAPEVQVSYKIYPNPVTNKLFVELQTSLPLDLKVGLYDIRGKETRIPIQEAQIVGSETLSFDTSSLPAAVYVLKLQRPDGSTIRLFKIQKNL